MDLVSPSNKGRPQTKQGISQESRKLTTQSVLPRIRFHDLRHTAASLMLNNVVLVIVVSQILGHSKTSITMDLYGHLIPSMQQQSADLTDNLVHPIEV